ncbi:Conserved membrane protein of uncharacterised function [Mycobacterium tuberculosis]|nr:Conserved membrane protein of uncharacterised function [Mycobacterium tuberculosis]
MNLTDTVATILAILALTAGTGVFVAAEFSLTALDRSTVEANARGGTSRDRFIQRAHHRLSFQLSGTALDQDGLPDDSMRWLATVIQMDGRRIDLLELIKMGGHADPGSGRGR